MNFEEFKNFYALTMMFYQRIEHDIKLIYAFMLKGDAGDNFDSIENIFCRILKVGLVKLLNDGFVLLNLGRKFLLLRCNIIP